VMDAKDMPAVGMPAIRSKPPAPTSLFISAR